MFEFDHFAMAHVHTFTQMNFTALSVPECARGCNREKRCQAAVLNSTLLQCTLYKVTNSTLTELIPAKGITSIFTISALKSVSTCYYRSIYCHHICSNNAGGFQTYLLIFSYSNVQLSKHHLPLESEYINGILII